MLIKLFTVNNNNLQLIKILTINEIYQPLMIFH